MTDETNVTELLPCPFCGSEELMHGSDYPGWDGRETTGNVQCGNCDAFTLQDTEADAIAAWNTRLAHSLPSQADETSGERVLREALAALLTRDMRNTCQHENTHRGGSIWEICDDCGWKWADDEGGKPEWQDPPEWVEARAALTKGAE